VTKKLRNVTITVLALTAGAGLLIWAAIDAQWIQTISAQELINNPVAYKSRPIQVYGRVVPGSIKEVGNSIEFDMYWPGAASRTAERLAKNAQNYGKLHVRYVGTAKIGLTNDAEILVNCTEKDLNKVEASRILTKCPSKYKNRKDYN
jgi:cytochrome c-type biogenesis protein CcmE